MNLRRTYRDLRQRAKLMRRAVLFFWQRRTRGFDDSEIWSLPEPLAKLIHARLLRFQEIKKSYPMGMTEAEWTTTISEMIWTFDWIASGKHWDGSPDDEKHARDMNRARCGLQLFAKYYFDLWS